MNQMEAEQRAPGLRVRSHEAQHQDEAQDAADISSGPAGAGEASDPVRRHQSRHHRVVEDSGELDTHGGKRVGQKQRRNEMRVAGRTEPHQR
jgi:hypothetical protein